MQTNPTYSHGYLRRLVVVMLASTLLLFGCGAPQSSPEMAKQSGENDATRAQQQTVAAQEADPSDQGEQTGSASQGQGDDKGQDEAPQPATGEIATFGSGCFWCSEAVFERLEGVEDVVSGYMGGKVPNPSYQDVCTGLTGHAEVVQIKYDPKAISFEELLEVFWKTHDPTTLNRQGYDVGTQYRSVIFYHNDSQRESASYYMGKLDESHAFPQPIVTKISPLSEFYVAEKYHQDYYAKNPGDGYCANVLVPKLEKMNKVFANKLKDR